MSLRPEKYELLAELVQEPPVTGSPLPLDASTLVPLETVFTVGEGESPGQTEERFYGQLCRSLDDNGVEDTFRLLRQYDGPAIELLVNAFRRACLRCDSTRDNRAIHGRLFFVPVAVRTGNLDAIPVSVDESIARLAQEHVHRVLKEEGRSDVTVIPLSPLFLLSELQTIAPDRFYPIVQAAVLGVQKSLPVPVLMDVGAREAVKDGEAVRLARDVGNGAVDRSGPWLTYRLWPLVLIAEVGNAIPKAVLSTAWRYRTSRLLESLAFMSGTAMEGRLEVPSMEILGLGDVSEAEVAGRLHITQQCLESMADIFRSTAGNGSESGSALLLYDSRSEILRMELDTGAMKDGVYVQLENSAHSYQLMNKLKSCLQDTGFWRVDLKCMDLMAEQERISFFHTTLH